MVGGESSRRHLTFCSSRGPKPPDGLRQKDAVASDGAKRPGASATGYCPPSYSNTKYPNPSGITSTAAGVVAAWKPTPGIVRWTPTAQTVRAAGYRPVS